MWFRGDLRLDDNPALQAACKGGSLLPIYVLDPGSFGQPTLAGARKCSARRARFLLESVRCLRQNLEARGSGLAVLLGKPRSVISEFCQGFQLFVTEGVCSEERAQELAVERRHDQPLHRLWGGTLYMPNECGCSPDNAPLLFTSFKNVAESRGRIRKPLDAPARLPALPAGLRGLPEALGYMPTLEDLGFAGDQVRAAMCDDPRACMVFEGGENAALRRLQAWMFDDDKLKDYFQIRNGMLGEAYSSKLSPWLATGCLSPRRVWSEVKRYEAERTKNKSTYWLVFELTWRDFFVYMARGQGDRIFKRGGVTNEHKLWSGSQDALQRWKDGTTNDPLVDANMRELKETGFMSNRGRQNVASYLIFDLRVDWRYGAAHFEEHLLDYDPCSNWGNWVAAAGLTGQRVNRFNTRKQLSDYDPGGEYVRHWLHSSSGGKRSRPNASPDIETRLSARSDRFGAKATPADGDARRAARLERFGIKAKPAAEEQERQTDMVATAAAPTPASESPAHAASEEDAKRLARLKRFGMGPSGVAAAKRPRVGEQLPPPQAHGA